MSTAWCVKAFWPGSFAWQQELGAPISRQPWQKPFKRLPLALQDDGRSEMAPFLLGVVSRRVDTSLVNTIASRPLPLIRGLCCCDGEFSAVLPCLLKRSDHAENEGQHLCGCLSERSDAFRAKPLHIRRHARCEKSWLSSRGDMISSAWILVMGCVGGGAVKQRRPLQPGARSPASSGRPRRTDSCNSRTATYFDESPRTFTPRQVPKRREPCTSAHTPLSLLPRTSRATRSPT